MAAKKVSSKKGPGEKPSSEARESRLIVEGAFELARKMELSTMLVRADLVQDRRLVERHRDGEKIIWLVRGEQGLDGLETTPRDIFVEVPEGSLGRLAQVTVGLTAAVLRKEIDVDESVVCLTGMAGSNRLDNLLVANPGRDFAWFRERKMKSGSGRMASEEGIRLLEIALKFAREGREGKPIGTIFVLGGPRALARYTRPMILNPLKGHPPKVRSIHNPDFMETMRELAAMDGAFIVDTRGIVAKACMYLDAPVTKAVQVKEGLGARHTAAAAISTRANAVAITVSESSGKVTVYAGGSTVLELEGRP